MPNYAITEIFKSIQGEGFHTGKTAIFVRFAGCNLWSGKLTDRQISKTCGKWCDTDFSKKLQLTLTELLIEITKLGQTDLIVLTGGEPLLQVDQALVDILNDKFHSLVCVETNGTIGKKLQNCWVTLSPKENTKLKLVTCSELKLVYPQQIDVVYLLDTIITDNYFVQPKDNLDNLANCLPILQKFPVFKLSLQIHKFLGVR